MKIISITICICFLNLTLLFAQTNSIGSLRTDETIITSLKSQFTLTEFDHANIVMSFNKDTIVVAGYLSDYSVGNSPKNVVYKTTNGGINWKIINFKGDAWIYNAHFEKDGKIWMGGSDEFVHYSNDYGSTWTKKQKPFKPNDRVLSIYMTDSINGVAGGLSNGLALTANNWKTTKQIQSPLDQHKFRILESSARDRIDKVEILESIIIIDQNNHIYYSELNPIAWKEFNIPVVDFSVDKTSKQWVIYSLRNKVYVLSAKLDLLKSYTEADPVFEKPEMSDTGFSFENFFSSEINKVKIKAVKYNFDRMSGGCIRSALYKENVQDMNIRDAGKISLLKEILITSTTYQKPLLKSFSLDKEDFRNYDTVYVHMKDERNEEKIWGGDFTSHINIENEYFSTPQKTISELDQSIVDSVYKEYWVYTRYRKNQSYIILDIINKNSDTLQISSMNSSLFSLPWTILYKGKYFRTYDARITEYLRTLLPKKYNYYDELLGGELIYRLIEQRIINELNYIKK